MFFKKYAKLISESTKIDLGLDSKKTLVDKQNIYKFLKDLESSKINCESYKFKEKYRVESKYKTRANSLGNNDDRKSKNFGLYIKNSTQSYVNRTYGNQGSKSPIQKHDLNDFSSLIYDEITQLETANNKIQNIGKKSNGNIQNGKQISKIFAKKINDFYQKEASNVSQKSMESPTGKKSMDYLQKMRKSYVDETGNSLKNSSDNSRNNSNENLLKINEKIIQANDQQNQLDAKNSRLKNELNRIIKNEPISSLKHQLNFNISKNLKDFHGKDITQYKAEKQYKKYKYHVNSFYTKINDKSSEIQQKGPQIFVEIGQSLEKQMTFGYT